MKHTIRLLILTILFIILTVPAAFASDTLDVITWTDNDTLYEGERIIVHTKTTNNTGQRVYITGISIDNVFYDLSFLIEPGNAETTSVQYTVNFGSKDSIGFPTYIIHDTNNDGNYLNDIISYSNMVYLYNANPPAPAAPSLDFVVSADSVDINKGDWVNYTITTTNTSGVDCSGFTVVSNGSDIESFPMMDGTTRTIYYSEQYFGDTIQEFGYYFYYDNGYYYEQIPDSTFVITIMPNSYATQQGPTDSPTPSPATTSKPTAASASTDKPTPTPTADTQPSSPAQSSAPASSETNQSTAAPSSGSNTNQSDANNTSSNTKENNSGANPMLIAFIVMSVLLASVLVVLIIILINKKKT